MKIRLKNLTKTYPDGRRALKDVSLELQPGLFGLLGPNGAGKTTLLSILTFLLEPSRGEVVVDGYLLPRDVRRFRTRLGFLPQYFDFFPQATGREVLEYFGRLFGLDRQTRKQRVDFLLRQVGLAPYQNRKTKDYSVGMKKRLGVAQALINDPDLLILDEPTSGLDPEERILFCSYLSELSADKTILLSTHIVSDVEEICSRMGILDSGRLVFVGPPWDFVRRAEGKTWRIGLSPDEAEGLNSRHAVVNRREDSGAVLLRFVTADTPPAGSEPVSPNLEDAYLLHFQDQLAKTGVV